MTAIKNDELFQTLLRYDSFLVRGDMSSSSFLATHLDSYCKEVDRALAGCNLFLGNDNLALVVNRIVRLKDICATIVKSLRLYGQGHIAKAMNLVVDLLEEHAEDMLGRQFCRDDCRLFRIRSGDHRARDNGQNEQRKSRAKLFHISMKGVRRFHRVGLVWPAPRVFIFQLGLSLPGMSAECRISSVTASSS